MTIRKARKLRNILIILGMAIIMLSGNNKFVILVGFWVALFCIVPDYLYNRCPGCNKRLGRNEGKFCQHCGKEVDVDICIKTK